MNIILKEKSRQTQEYKDAHYARRRAARALKKLEI